MQNRPRLYIWQIKRVSRQTRTFFDHRVVVDTAEGLVPPEVLAAIQRLKGPEDNGSTAGLALGQWHMKFTDGGSRDDDAIVQFRGHFRDMTEADETKLTTTHDMDGFCPHEYYEDEASNPLTLADFMDVISGQTGAEL